MANSDQIYKGILTPAGVSAILNAISQGETLKLSFIGIGDGDGDVYTPIEGQTDLRNEVHEISVNDLFIDPNNPSWVVIEGYIPENVGGFWIREISVKDISKQVIAVASYPATYKPQMVEGASKAEVIRLVIEVSNTSVFELLIDTSLALVTRDEFIRHTSQTTGVHGSSVDPLPDTLAERYEGGRLKVGTPVVPEDAATLQQITDLMALIEHTGDSGVPLWIRHTGDGTTTRFQFMGILRDNPNAVAVFLDGVKQIGGEHYTVDISQPISAIVFTAPPSHDVAIEFLTMVYLSQIPLATTVTPGVVVLASPATFGMDKNSVVTAGHLSGNHLYLTNAERVNSWELNMKDAAQLTIEQDGNISVVESGNLHIGGEADFAIETSKIKDTINGALVGTNGVFSSEFLNPPLIDQMGYVIDGSSRIYRISGNVSITSTIPIMENTLRVGDIYYFMGTGTISLNQGAVTNNTYTLNSGVMMFMYAGINRMNSINLPIFYGFSFPSPNSGGGGGGGTGEITVSEDNINS